MKFNVTADDFGSGSQRKAPTARPATPAPAGGGGSGHAARKTGLPIYNAGRPRLGEERRRYVNCTTGGDADQWARLAEVAYELRKTRADLIYEIFADFLEKHDAGKKHGKQPHGSPRA